MITYIFNCARLSLLLFLLCFAFTATAQTDSSFIQRIPADTSTEKLSMDAVYDRPFLTAGKFPVALGGYLEANTEYAATDGVSDGLSFQFRRMSLFFSSTIGQRIKFLAELEFEDGTKEINLEYASLDVEFHPLFNLRGGIILNPIGTFNQNHDGPKWEFIDRPISSRTILPATLSTAGFGFHGKHFVENWVLGYEAYLSNGFDDQVISNSQDRTSLAAGKSNPDKFEESFNGVPMFTGKIAVRNRKLGEAGISFLTGVYNKWQSDGIVLEDKKSASALAFDFNTSLLKNRINITTEIAKVFVEVPDTYTQAYGTRQFGLFTDITGTILQQKILGWEKAKVNLAIRFEYADYNQGTFEDTGGNISDDVWALVPALSFRPVGATVFRFNYRYEWQQDLLGNPPAKTGVIQFGFASYF
ncbi:MAG: hypothetical protein KBF32_12470 [Chitinophagales bacterium]|nr:hypothetical protein [Chitinophagales bacterium]